MHVKYIGLDLHKKSIFATVLDGDGNILSKTKIGPKSRDICYNLKSQGTKGELSVAMEASYNWPYYYRAADKATVKERLEVFGSKGMCAPEKTLCFSCENRTCGFTDPRFKPSAQTVSYSNLIEEISRKVISNIKQGDL